MNEPVIELLARTSNKKRIDDLLGRLIADPEYRITKLEYNKEFKNWCIWGFQDEPKSSTTKTVKENKKWDAM